MAHAARRRNSRSWAHRQVWAARAGHLLRILQQLAADFKPSPVFFRASRNSRGSLSVHAANSRIGICTSAYAPRHLSSILNASVHYALTDKLAERFEFVDTLADPHCLQGGHHACNRSAAWRCSAIGAVHSAQQSSIQQPQTVQHSKVSLPWRTFLWHKLFSCRLGADKRPKPEACYVS